MIVAANRSKAETSDSLGAKLYALADDLFPICRSVAGPGVRETLARLSEYIPLDLHETPSGTRVFDWTVPSEWQIADAYVLDASGRRVIDFRRSNLHVVNYSRSVRAEMTLDELRSRLFTDPARPDVIPYRTCTYRDDWGFCLSENELRSLPEGRYSVNIESRHYSGALVYGECIVPGATDEEVLISAHVCHPSLANDNLSGIAVAAGLAKWAASAPRKYTYRFVFAPATIGALCWLNDNPRAVETIHHGLVLTLLGDEGDFTYKRCRRGDSAIDRATTHLLKHSGQGHEIIDFTPFGYDERQYGSPGFNLPVGRLMRTPHERYPHYHSSADDMSAIFPEQLARSHAMCVAIFEMLERNARFINLQPHGEPQLGRRGLYSQPLAGAERSRFEQAVLWVLNLSDGKHDLLAIADRADLPFNDVFRAAQALVTANLLSEEAPA